RCSMCSRCKTAVGPVRDTEQSLCQARFCARTDRSRASQALLLLPTACSPPGSPCSRRTAGVRHEPRRVSEPFAGGVSFTSAGQRVSQRTSLTPADFACYAALRSKGRHCFCKSTKGESVNEGDFVC